MGFAACIQEPSLICSFLHQRSSWSPLQITEETFLKISSQHTLPTIVLDAISSFGSKITGEDNPYHEVCHATISPSRPLSQESNYTQGLHNRSREVKVSLTVTSEVCFTVRHFEKHGRTNLKNPWSLRQMMVYLRHRSSDGKTLWIFVQPFHDVQKVLSEHTLELQKPMRILAMLLSVGISDWRSYLNDMRKCLSLFVSLLSS